MNSCSRATGTGFVAHLSPSCSLQCWDPFFLGNAHGGERLMNSGDLGVETGNSVPSPASSPTRR